MKKYIYNESNNTQKGAALITSLIFMVVLTLLALSSMNTSILDENMAANAQEKNRAFQAAETALAVALENANSFNTLGSGKTPIEDVGDYNAEAEYTSSFLNSKDATAVFASGSDIQGDNQTYNYFNIEVTAKTKSGASTTINAGAWHL